VPCAPRGLLRCRLERGATRQLRSLPSRRRRPHPTWIGPPHDGATTVGRLTRSASCRRQQRRRSEVVVPRPKASRLLAIYCALRVLSPAETGRRTPSGHGSTKDRATNTPDARLFTDTQCYVDRLIRRRSRWLNSDFYALPRSDTIRSRPSPATCWSLSTSAYLSQSGTQGSVDRIASHSTRGREIAERALVVS
jgi:hypothetical protein